MKKVIKSKCYNCRFAGEGFKVARQTHHHCFEPTQYPQEKLQAGEVSPWDTLREWWDTCKHHEPLVGERFIDTIRIEESDNLALMTQLEGFPF